MTGQGRLGIGDLLRALELEPIADGSFRATNVPTGPGVVFGGQLLAQSVLAASRALGDKPVKTIHTVFARAGAMEQGVEIDVEPVHDGRSFGSASVTIRQGERVCTRSLVLVSADEPDLIRHGLPVPAVAGADASPDAGHLAGDWEIRVVDGVDVNDPEAVGPATLDVWTRFVGAPDDPVTAQALLAFATDGFLIGTAMRPHPGVGQSQAHVTLATGVVSHTLTFHEPFRADEWLLLDQTSPYAGRGRAYGRGDIFTADGTLVASFVQDSMIRAMPGGAGQAQ